jgi:FixJ family two-component response regulator
MHGFPATDCAPAVIETNHPQKPESASLVCVIENEPNERAATLRLFRAKGIPARGFASVGDFLDQPAHDGPCCVLVDMDLPGQLGFDLQRALAHRSERIVFITGDGDVPMCARAMKAGAEDFLTKPVLGDVLFSAVLLALAHSAQARARHARHCLARTRLAALTHREIQVMHFVVKGLLNKQIAYELGIAEKTVKIHRGRVMQKTQCVSVPDLVRLVQSASLSNPDSQ